MSDGEFHLADEPDPVDGDGAILNVGDRVYIDGEPRLYGEVMSLEWDVCDEDSPQGASSTIFMDVKFDGGDLETVRGNNLFRDGERVVEFSDYTRVVA